MITSGDARERMKMDPFTFLDIEPTSTVVEIKQRARSLTSLDKHAIEMIDRAIEISKSNRLPARMIDGATTREIGMGYPIHVEAQICLDCYGDGFILQNMMSGTIPCSLCRGAGLSRVSRKKCTVCTTSSRPSCRNCSGSGEETFVTLSSPPKTCEACTGRGFVTVTPDNPIACLVRCMSCIGIGEVCPSVKRSRIETRRHTRIQNRGRGSFSSVQNREVGCR